ncbi:MAG TPA: hypothetical protein VF532_04820 [Candidatus Angelobacter sp.]
MQVPQGFERFPYQSLLEGAVWAATLIGLLIWGIYLVNAAFKRRQQNLMQKALLDKFSSAQDFAEFMQSPAGQKYVMSFTDAVASPRNAILNTIRTGFVLFGVGCGFLAEAYSGVSRRIGWVAFLAGVGFLISAAVSYFLAKKAGWKVEG